MSLATIGPLVSRALTASSIGRTVTISPSPDTATRIGPGRYGLIQATCR